MFSGVFFYEKKPLRLDNRFNNHKGCGGGVCQLI